MQAEVALLDVRADGAVAQLRRGGRLAPRILGRSPGGPVRAAFAPTRAGPLAGDEDRARIVVRAGATLIVEPIAATLALPGGAWTRLSLDVDVESGGRLVIDEGPLIVAAGSSVERRCALTLGAGAVVALRETVVLGRDGEPPGTLVSTLRATLDGRALLHDGLRLGPDRDAYVALAPGHRVVSTVALLGARPADASPGALALERPGAFARASGPSLAVVEHALGQTWAGWSRAPMAPMAEHPAAIG